MARRRLARHAVDGRTDTYRAPVRLARAIPRRERTLDSRARSAGTSAHRTFGGSPAARSRQSWPRRIRRNAGGFRQRNRRPLGPRTGNCGPSVGDLGLRAMTVSRAVGLTAAEVAQRVAQGRVNDVPSRATRTVVDIIRANVFTRINAILAVLLAIV